jgi:signal transduction histidine kinase
MAAVQQRVQHMGGTLDVRSTLGSGTTWIIEFPWSPKEVPTARMSRPPSVYVPAPRVDRAAS